MRFLLFSCVFFLLAHAARATPLPENIPPPVVPDQVSDGGTVCIHNELRIGPAGMFINVGFGRDTRSLLLKMVPWVIINAEEEHLSTGVDSFGLYSNR